MASTKIEWCDRAWNPISGCQPTSSGCLNCYAKRMAPRLAGRYGYPADDPFRPTMHPDKLPNPLHWKKPAIVFVNSMGDLFHKDIPDEFIAAVFGVMAASPQHFFIVLTKRPERMRAWFKWVGNHCSDNAHADPAGEVLSKYAARVVNEEFALKLCDGYPPGYNWWPLPNLALGVSVEDQKTADERIPLLLQTPAACRMLSYEPALGPIDIVRPIGDKFMRDMGLEPVGTHAVSMSGEHGLHWVVSAGESGTAKGIRPAHPEWFRNVRVQCAAAGVPYFFKGFGAWGVYSEHVEGTRKRAGIAHDHGNTGGTRRIRIDLDGNDRTDENLNEFRLPTGWVDLYKVGKKKSGAMLDGVEIKQYPAIMEPWL